MRFLYFVCFLLVSSKAFSDPKPDFFNQFSSIKGDNLYIDSVESVKDLDSIVYYISNSKTNAVLLNDFKKFAEEIGKSNGAVILPVNENKEDHAYIESNITKKKIPSTYKFVAESNCDFTVYETSQRIIFESFHDSTHSESECFYYKIENSEEWFANTLGLIYKHIKSLDKIDDLKKEEVKNIIMKDIEWGVQPVDNNKQEIDRLIGLILDYLFTKISTS